MDKLNTLINENMNECMNTQSIDLDDAIRSTKNLFSYLGIEFPKHVLYSHSPLMANKMISHLKYDFDKYIKEFINGNYPSNFYFSKDNRKKFNCIDINAYLAGNLEMYKMHYLDAYDIDMDTEFNKLCIDYFRSTHITYFEYDTIIFCDRPLYITLEGVSVSSRDSAAIEYSDGFKVYSIDGYMVDPKIILTPEMITLEDIINEDNSEIRRITIERYGVSKYLADSNSKVLDADYSGLPGSSLRTLIEDGFKNRWLIGSDGSTGRVYHMPVPDHVETCRQAHNEIAGFDESKIISES
jgi:hypothetical protein